MIGTRSAADKRRRAERAAEEARRAEEAAEAAAEDNEDDESDSGSETETEQTRQTVARPKGESAAEKKARKAAIKAERAVSCACTFLPYMLTRSHDARRRKHTLRPLATRGRSSWRAIRRWWLEVERRISQWARGVSCLCDRIDARSLRHCLRLDFHRI